MSSIINGVLFSFIVIFLFQICYFIGSPLAASKSKTNSKSASKETSEFTYFSANDAAVLLGVPSGQVTSRIEKSYEGFWMCSFSADKGKKIISFSVTISKSVKIAADEMERYRENLETAGSVKPFKNNLPSGAYSDIMGLGDDAVWTDINGTLTARKGHISIQVTNPREKKEQIKVIQAFFKKI
ncbi:MAG: hypothetical protein AB1659_11085, partial [Thermodesulfobacteriota bacterium]